MKTHFNGNGDAGFSGCTLIERPSYSLRRSAMLQRFSDMRRSSDSPVPLFPFSPFREFSDSERFDSKI